jgi:hypothetical protein
MPTLQQRPGRTAPLPVVLVLAGAVLAGCTGAPPVAPPPTAPLAPSPAAGPGDAALCGPKVFGAEQPEDAWVRFDVTREQLQVIEPRLLRVLCRQGLWRKGVGFGVNFDQERNTWFVLIHPGFSGLTARQVLDRLLGR